MFFVQRTITCLLFLRKYKNNLSVLLRPRESLRKCSNGPSGAHGFPMGCPWGAHGVPMGAHGVPHGCPWVPMGCPMCRPWVFLEQDCPQLLRKAVGLFLEQGCPLLIFLSVPALCACILELCAMGAWPQLGALDFRAWVWRLGFRIGALGLRFRVCGLGFGFRV